MLSTICRDRNETIIPSLMSQHVAVLTGDGTIVDMSTAENWAAKEKLVPLVKLALEDLSAEDLAYSSGVGGCTRTRKCLAELLNNGFSPFKTIDASHIVLAAGGSFALTALVEQICDPGDGVLIAAPYWAGLDLSLCIHAKAKVVPVHVPLQDFFSPESVGYYEEALRTSSVPIKAVLLCNPHNPLGQCYPRQTLADMQAFCGRHGLHYISDEVYALSAHRPSSSGVVPFISALTFDPERGTAPVHIVYSLSKDFGCNGIRLGAIISQSDQALRLSTALSVHSQVSSLSTAVAYKSLLKLPVTKEIVDFGGERLHEGYKTVCSFFQVRNIDHVPAHYGMFVFARLAELETLEAERELYKSLSAHGVSLSTGSSYHFNEPGWFRICYGMSQAALTEGLKRIESGIAVYKKLEKR